MYCIYKITNLINKKIYIGQTIQHPQKRWNYHLHCKNKHPLYHSIKYYGGNNFEFKVIAFAKNTISLNESEKFFIKHYNSQNPKYGYNLESGGRGCGKISETTRLKMRLAKLNTKMSPESIAKRTLTIKLNNSMGLRKKFSDSTKNKMRIAALKRDNSKLKNITRKIVQKNFKPRFNLEQISIIKNMYIAELIGITKISKKFQTTFRTIKSILSGTYFPKIFLNEKPCLLSYKERAKIIKPKIIKPNTQFTSDRVSGVKNNNAKLNPAIIKEIRDLYATKTYSYNKLAKIFNVDCSNIYCIIKLKTWKNI